jgi:hypothetical protein
LPVVPKQRTKQNSAMQRAMSGKRRAKTTPCSVQRKKHHASAQTKKKTPRHAASEKKNAMRPAKKKSAQFG